MIKSIALASAVLLTGATGASAVELGFRSEAGASYETVTHGRRYSSFNGRTRTRTRSVELNGGIGGGGASGGSGGAGGGVIGGDRTVTVSRTREYFRGGESSRFSGGSNSSFSQSSIFSF